MTSPDTPSRGASRVRLRALAATGARQSMVTIDQLLFSTITFAVQLIAAAVSNAADFGIFSLVAIVQIGQWYLGRGLASEPLLVSQVAREDDPSPRRGAAAASLSLGLTTSVVCVALALTLDGPARTLLLIQALAAPFTAVLDHARYVSYAQQRARRALLLDSGWLLTFLAAVAITAAVSGLSAISTYLIWALTAIPAALLATMTAGAPLWFSEIRRWLVSQRRLIPGFMIDAAYLTAGTWATFGVAAWVVGLDGLGLLRKALVPVTALTVLFIGIGNAMLAHLAGRGAREVIRAPALVSALAAAVSGVCALATLGAPSGVLTTILGSPWEQVRPLVLVLVLYAFLLATAQTALGAAKASGRAWVGPLVRTAQFLSEIALVAGLGLAFGVAGVAFGMALAWAIAAVLAWGGLLSRRRRAETAVVGSSSHAPG